MIQAKYDIGEKDHVSDRPVRSDPEQKPGWLGVIPAN